MEEHFEVKSNKTVQLDENVETQLKVKAEAFAMRVFDNPVLYCDYPSVVDAAVEIYKISAAGQTTNQLKPPMKI